MTVLQTIRSTTLIEWARLYAHQHRNGIALMALAYIAELSARLERGLPGAAAGVPPRPPQWQPEPEYVEYATERP